MDRPGLANSVLPASTTIDSQVLERALALPGPEQSPFVCSFYRDNPAAAERMLRFLARMESLGSFLGQSPIFGKASSPRHFQPGDLIASRFKILSLAGMGGMASVYRVTDNLSGEVLALKVCRESIAPSVSELDFLREEILLARRISHPNVCRIHELFTSEENGRPAVFFTMEWLDGKTLTEHINCSPLSPAEALSIAGQVAAGLDAVHRASIVHRDLKPGNILLVPGQSGSGRAVITDFGLARAVPTLPLSESTDASSPLVGTPDYMAPEQFLGNAAGPATDVYALALIVFEMVAGRKLYGNASFLQIVIRRVTEENPPGTGLNGVVPDEWVAPLACALSRQPSGRYQTAGAFIEAIQGSTQETMRPEGRNRETILGIRGPSRRSIIGISASVALCVSSGWAFSRWYGLGSLKGARPSLMLAPITFSSGQSDAAAYARTAEHLLRLQLGQSAYLSLLSRDEMERAWQRTSAPAGHAALPEFLDPKTARQIALRSGSPYILYESLGQTGDERLLRVRLELLDGSVFAARKSSSKEFVLHEDRDLLDAVHEAARWVRVTVGESDQSVAAHFSRPEELTTPSWAALKEYTAGDHEWKAGKPGPAIIHLKTALDIDNQFAAACTRLADIYMANGQPDDAYVQYATASRLFTARNLTDRESLMGRGLFALDVGLNNEAEAVFARYILEYPADPLPKFYRATALDMLNRREEGETLLAEAVRLAPSNYSFVMGCARHFIEAGQEDRAQKYWERGRAINPSDWTDQFAMTIAFVRNDLNSAAGAIARMRATGSQEFKSKSFALEACLMAEQRRWADAESILLRGLDFDKRTGSPAATRSTKQRMLCQVYLSQNEIQRARCMCLESLAEAPGHETRLQIAGVLAGTGDFPLDPNDLCGTRSGGAGGAKGCRSTPAGAAGVAESSGRTHCSVADLPPWPIYQYWERRLRVELSLSKGNVAVALRILTDIPEPPIRHVFPDHVLRAARAANDREGARSTLQLLTSQLGRWWLEPERNAPGFVQTALTGAV